MLQHGLDLSYPSMYMSLHNTQIWEGFLYISLSECWAHSLGNTCSNLTRKYATECECNVQSLVTRECGAWVTEYCKSSCWSREVTNLSLDGRPYYCYNMIQRGAQQQHLYVSIELENDLWCSDLEWFHAASVFHVELCLLAWLGCIWWFQCDICCDWQLSD